MRRSLIVISQVYVPDPMAVGQHMADAAEEMARRGWRVVVYTSARGYDDPSVRFPRRESLGGVEIRRLPLSSFGKGSIAVRLVAQTLFVLQAILHSVFLPRATAVLATTSPPFGGFAGAIVSLLHRCPLVWWVMDLNPDQMVLAGKLRPRSIFARVFDWMNRVTLARARDVIVLDRFMEARVLAKRYVAAKLHVIPPWAHAEHLELVPHAANPFRKAHGLDGKRVVMYSGNAGFSTPLDTLIAAAKQLEHDSRLHFVFIGGGVVKKKIDDLVAATRPPNVTTLPYQPLDSIRYSLSAADVHVVSIADEGVGVVHPCKVYGAMALAKPVLALGPAESYVGDLLARYEIGWLREHGDVAGVVDVLEQARDLPEEELTAIGRRAVAASTTACNPAMLRDRVCDVIEGVRRAAAA